MARARDRVVAFGESSEGWRRQHRGSSPANGVLLPPVQSGSRTPDSTHENDSGVVGDPAVTVYRSVRGSVAFDIDELPEHVLDLDKFAGVFHHLIDVFICARNFVEQHFRVTVFDT